MAGFAEELRRIPMSQGLGATLARSADYAQAQQHGEVALEHLLLALTEDDDAAQVLSASHVDMALLKADVSLYLGGLSGGGDAGQMSLAPDLKRILEAAAAAASQGRRREINGAIVLAAIVGDGRSSAAHMLRAQGLTFEEAIKALQRALAATAPPAPVAGKADAEDILATARARVQTRAAPGLPPAALRPDPVVVPVVPPKADPVAAIKPEPVAELPSTPPAWPPEVRTSDAGAEQVEPVVDFDAVQAEIEAARYHEAEANQAYQPSYDNPSYEQAYQDAPDPLLGDFADADRYVPLAEAAPPLPMPMPPMLPPMTAIPAPAPSRYAASAAQSPPTSRWPAPVSPAWKDQQGSVRHATEEARSPHSPPVPPPLPPVQQDWEQPAHVIETQPGWPGPDLHEQYSGYEQANAHGHPPFDGRTEPAFGGAVAPSALPNGPPPQVIRPNGSLPNDFARNEHGQPAGLGHSGLGHGDELVSYDSSWPHQEPAPHWGEAGHGSPHVPVALPPVEGGGQTAPRARRRKVADRAAAGQLGDGIPRKMRAHVASNVDVALTKGEFLALLDGLSDDSDHRVEAGCLSVKLRAPDGRFIVDSVSPETQWAGTEAGLGTSDSVSWRWMVTPLNPGHRRLQLVVSARTPSANGPAVVTALPEQIINVRVGSNFGRGLAKLAGWIVIAAVGGLIAKYGAAVLEPGIAELMKALK